MWTQVCRWPLILCLYIFANSAVAAFAEHEKLGRKENLQVAACLHSHTCCYRRQTVWNKSSRWRQSGTKKCTFAPLICPTATCSLFQRLSSVSLSQSADFEVGAKTSFRSLSATTVKETPLFAICLRKNNRRHLQV